jgi:hypothetical protein
LRAELGMSVVSPVLMNVKRHSTGTGRTWRLGFTLVV